MYCCRRRCTVGLSSEKVIAVRRPPEEGRPFCVATPGAAEVPAGFCRYPAADSTYNHPIGLEFLPWSKGRAQMGGRLEF